jgi:Rho-related BTB domain-containing protein 1/2
MYCSQTSVLLFLPLILVLSREITDEDILLPEDGRNVAAKIGASYYETSVYNQFGVEDLFMNVLRAALVYKRNRHFWLGLSSLKHISGPLWQAPYCEPQPEAPVASAAPLDPDAGLWCASCSPEFSDVVFVVGGLSIMAHAACLAVGSQLFFDVLSIACLGKDTSATIRCCGIVAAGNMTAELSLCCSNFSSGSVDIQRLDHAVFRFVVRHKVIASGPRLAPVIVVDSSVSPCAFNMVLHYIYTGKLESNLTSDLCSDIQHLAIILGITDLVSTVANYREDFLNLDTYKCFLEKRMVQIKKMLISGGLFSGKMIETFEMYGKLVLQIVMGQRILNSSVGDNWIASFCWCLIIVTFCVETIEKNLIR